MPTTELPVAQLKAELFKALAHPVRVQALEQIVAQERSVSELAASLGIEISHLSKQLSILRKAGVVDTRREGTTIYYSVRDPRLAEIFAVARELIVANLEVAHTLLASLRSHSEKMS
jgi:ArsR family transcriptional regulator